MTAHPRKYTKNVAKATTSKPDLDFFEAWGIQASAESKREMRALKRQAKERERAELRRQQLEWEAFDRKAPPLELPPPPSFHIQHVPLWRLPTLRRADSSSNDGENTDAR